MSDAMLDPDEFAEDFRASLITNIAKRLPTKNAPSFVAWTEAGCPEDDTWTPLLKSIGSIPVMSQDEFKRMR